MSTLKRVRARERQPHMRFVRLCLYAICLRIPGFVAVANLVGHVWTTSHIDRNQKTFDPRCSPGRCIGGRHRWPVSSPFLSFFTARRCVARTGGRPGPDYIWTSRGTSQHPKKRFSACQDLSCHGRKGQTDLSKRRSRRRTTGPDGATGLDTWDIGEVMGIDLRARGISPSVESPVPPRIH
jgi:hypothetical protein